MWSPPAAPAGRQSRRSTRAGSVGAGKTDASCLGNLVTERSARRVVGSSGQRKPSTTLTRNLCVANPFHDLRQGGLLSIHQNANTIDAPAQQNQTVSGCDHETDGKADLPGRSALNSDA